MSVFLFDDTALVQKWLRQRDLPKNDFLKQPLLLHVLGRFVDERVYTEEEVNAEIAQFFSDVPLVRRELTNFGYMRRDPRKGTYWVAKRELTMEYIRSNTRLARHAEPYGVR